MRSLLALTLLVGCTGSETEMELAPDAAQAASEGVNILDNGDFEHLNATQGIVDWGFSDGNPNAEARVVDEAHSGSHALQWQLQASAGDGEWVTQRDVPLMAGHRYALTGWYHTDGGGVALNYIVRGQPNDAPEKSSVALEPRYPKIIGEWAPFRFELTLPLEPVPQTWDVSLQASATSNHKTTKLTIDEVRLVEIPTKGGIAPLPKND